MIAHQGSQGIKVASPIMNIRAFRKVPNFIFSCCLFGELSFRLISYDIGYIPIY